MFTQYRLSDEGKSMSTTACSWKRLLVWKFLLITSILHSTYTNARMVDKMVQGPSEGIAETGIHIVRCIMSCIMTYWAYDGFVCHAVEKSIIYNYTHSSMPDDVNKKLGYHQDSLVCNTPTMLYPLAIYFALFFLAYSDSSQYIYSVLPIIVRGWTTMGIYAILEWLMVLFWLAQAHLYVLLNTPFLQKVEHELLTGTDFSTNGDRIGPGVLENKTKVLREVQAAMTIHNVGNSNSIFAQKVLSITLSIASFYYFVRLTTDMPRAALMFLVNGFNSTSFYSVQWDRAHRIPTLMVAMRRELLRRSQGRSSQAKAIRKKVKSIAVCGVKSGSFRWMERGSTLIFNHFVFTNVISLLISV